MSAPIELAVAELPALPPPVAYLAAAQAAMPGYTDVQRAIAAVQRQLIRPPAGMALYPDVAALAATAAAGEPLPADLAERVLAADRAKLAEETRRLWTQNVIGRLTAELQNVRTRELDAGLRFLDGELRELLGHAAAALAVVGSVRGAEDALRAPAEQREGFLRLADLTGRLARLRTAQRQLMRDTLDYMSDTDENTRTLLRYAGTVANLAEVLPDWQEVARSGGRRPMPQGNPDPDPDLYRLTPWRLDPGTREPLVPVIDVDHLVWLVESPAVPWVPTAAEARLATDVLLQSTKPRLSEQEQVQHDRAAMRMDEAVEAHARNWNLREQAGYRPDGTPIH